MPIAYPATTVEKKAVGFGDLLWGGEKPLCYSEAAFFMSARVFYGRAGWDSREAMPVLHRFANPFGSALPFGDGGRFVSRTGAQILSQSKTRHDANKPRIDLTGRRFGRLTVVEFHSIERHMTMWRCICDCGTSINVHRGSLTKGATQSCGCLHRERTSAANGKHWACDTVTYRCWKSMRTRCAWPKSKDYPRYGGRGIKICERWMASFDNFLADMGECPGKGWTIERNDVNGNYEPSNCRWATKLEQARNTSRNRFLTHAGKTLCISEWAQITGLTNTTIMGRLNSGKTVAEALAPLAKPTPPRRNWTEQEITEICARYAAGGISQVHLAAEYSTTQWKIHMLIKSRAERKTCLHGISSAAPCAQCDQEIEAMTS